MVKLKDAEVTIQDYYGPWAGMRKTPQQLSSNLHAHLKDSRDEFVRISVMIRGRDKEHCKQLWEELIQN